MNQKWLILIAVLALLGVLVWTSDHKHTEKVVPLPPPHQMPKSTQVPAPLEADPWLIKPGEGVGKITAHSTLLDLQKAYGTDNVRLEQVSGAEGETYPGAVLFPNEPRKRLEIIWAEKSKTPESILIREEADESENTGTLWHTGEGVTLGTSLKTLEALNRGPFTLSGFDWDYGGMVLSWGDQGKLKEDFQGKLVLRLEPSEHPPAKAMEAVEGDRQFSSSNPNMQTVRPTVDEIIVMFR